MNRLSAIAAAIVISAACLLPGEAQSDQSGSDEGSKAVPSQAALPGASNAVSGHFVAATNRTAALQQAKVGAGRPDPFVRLSQPKPFPAHVSRLLTAPEHRKEKDELSPDKHKLPYLPPPPIDAVPPLPPGSFKEALEKNTSDDLPVGELPQPPAKPTIADKLQLQGIIDDKAIFAINDPVVAHAHQWSQAMMVGAGDRLDTVSVVSVAPGVVTLEEDGQQITKELPRIR